MCRAPVTLGTGVVVVGGGTATKRPRHRCYLLLVCSHATPPPRPTSASPCCAPACPVRLPAPFLRRVAAAMEQHSGPVAIKTHWLWVGGGVPPERVPLATMALLHNNTTLPVSPAVAAALPRPCRSRAWTAGASIRRRCCRCVQRLRWQWRCKWRAHQRTPRKRRRCVVTAVVSVLAVVVALLAAFAVAADVPVA